ncbi:MAG: J domain-containing protein [Pseudomonadota bacterium]
MFERNRIDNNRDVVAVGAQVELSDGVQLTGKMIVTRARDVQETLNGSDPFIAFEPYGEDRMLIAKAQIRSVRPIEPAAVPSLSARIRDRDGFDPHTVLGVAKRADWDEIRSAFHKLSLAYHPDRYANASLPADVTDYLAATARQINAAYSALEAAHYRPAGADRAAPSTPIYEKSASR